MKLYFLKNKQSAILLTLIFLILLSPSCTKDESIEKKEEANSYIEYVDFVEDGLIAYFPFNKDANDYSGNNNHGSIQGTTNTYDRFNRANQALSLDGIDDFIEIVGLDNFNGTQGSICLWIKSYNDLNYQRAIFSKVSEAKNGYIISDGLWFDHIKECGTIIGSSLYNSLSEVNYSFLVMTVSEKKYTFYLNGEQIVELTDQSPESINNANILIGKSHFNGSISSLSYQNFKGEIDDLLIYNKALTKEEVIKLYNFK